MSKYDKYKDNDIFPHKHCPICSNIVPEEDSEFGEYCSLECASKTQVQKKSKRKRWILLGGSYVVVIAVLIVLMILNNR
jgi:predicted nucleic acid-binding Zn ribbon protein